MLLGDAVDGGRRDEDDPADARVTCGQEDVLGSADVDRADRRARGLDRERGRGVHDDVSAGAEPARPFGVADVASLLVHRALELGVVQRHDVQRADLVTLGEQPPREVQAEKARTAGDRPRGHSDGR